MISLHCTTVRVADYGVCLSPAQESAPGNDGDVSAQSERAGITRILHPLYGFSNRRSSEHRGIIKSYIPLLWQRTAPGFANVQPPLFMDTQE